MIEPGEKGRADDFIYEADRSVDPTDDAGKVPKLEEEDGKISDEYIRHALKFKAGEELTAGMPVGIATGEFTEEYVTRAGAAIRSQSTIDNIRDFFYLNNNKFVVIFISNIGTGTCDSIIATVDPDTLEVSFGGAGATYSTPDGRIRGCKLTTDRFVVLWAQDGDNSHVQYKLHTVSGTSISEDANGNLLTDGNGFGGADCVQLTTNTFAYTAFKGSATNATVGYAVVTGNSLSTNASVANDDSPFGSGESTVHRLTDTKFMVIADNLSGGNVKGRVGTFSAGSVTLGTVQNIGSGSTNAESRAVNPSDNVLIVRVPGGVVHVTVSGSTITGVDSEDTSSTTGTVWIDPSNSKIYDYSSDNKLYLITYGVSITRTLLYSNIAIPNSFFAASDTGYVGISNDYYHIKGMTANYIGFVKSDAVLDDEVLVQYAGRDDNQSDLNPGTVYEISGGGLLATDDLTAPYKVTAISENSILI